MHHPSFCRPLSAPCCCRSRPSYQRRLVNARRLCAAEFARNLAVKLSRGGVSACHFISRRPVALLAPPQIQFDGHFAKGESIAKHTHQVSPVGLRDRHRIGRKQNHGRRLNAHLRGEENLRLAILVDWGWVGVDRGAQQFIQISRAHALPRLLEQHLSMIQQRLDILAGFPRDECNRHVMQPPKCVVQITNPFFRRHTGVLQIPFVNDENARLVLFGDVIAQLLINFADPLRTIEKQQHDIGPSHAPLCAMQAVIFHVAGDAAAPL